MRKLAKVRTMVLGTAVAGVLAAVCAIVDFERAAIALLGVAIALLSLVLFLIDSDARDRLLPRAARRSKTSSQLDAVQTEVHRIAVDLEETQRRLITTLEVIRLESAERDNVARNSGREI